MLHTGNVTFLQKRQEKIQDCVEFFSKASGQELKNPDVYSAYC